MTSQRHLVTPEYPPEVGGVADFCRILAEGMADQGVTVHVWCPPWPGSVPTLQGVSVHPTLGNFGWAALDNTSQELNDTPAPRRLIVQWVPHGYGWRSMNVAFVWWVARRARRGDRIELMVHEPFVMFEGSPRQWVAAAVHRLMVTVLLRSVERVWCTIPKWEELLRPYAPKGLPFRTLPVFSCVPSRPESQTDQEFDFGHFSGFARSTATPLAAVLPVLLDRMIDARMLLVGRGGEQFRDQLIANHPSLAGRVSATGEVPLSDVPTYLSRCRVLVQPVAGGVSGRNTSVLAGLANARAVVTTTGPLTEPYWETSGAVALAPDGHPERIVDQAVRLATDRSFSHALRQAATNLYDRRFHRRHLIEAVLAR